MTKKARPQLLLSPAGIAIYPHLHEPDSRFSEQEPKYKVKLRLDPNKPEVASFLATLDRLMDEGFEQLKQENPKFASRMKREFPPYVEECDKDSGDPTGFVVLDFKSKASVKSKTDPNKVIQLKPRLFDAKNKPLSEDVRIGGGSTLKIAFTTFPFAFANVKAGLTLRLEAVQVLDLVEWTGGGKSPFEEAEGYVGDNDAPFGDEGGETESSGDNDF